MAPSDQLHQRSFPEFEAFSHGGNKNSSCDISVEGGLIITECMAENLQEAASLSIEGGDSWPKHVPAGIIFTFFLGVVWYLFSRSWSKISKSAQPTRPRGRTSSSDMQSALTSIPTTRERLPTDDSHARQLPSPGIAEGNVIWGYAATSVKYVAWTPPTPWTDASKHLLPTNIKMKSQVSKVQIELNLAKGKLFLEDSNTSFDVNQVKLHVKQSTGAVLELFIGDTKMEHTFLSAQSAAQFQHDLLAFQIVGKSLMNMYYSLELVHRGSKAHEGTESVLHDAVGDSEVIPAAVAWDDLFRCLGGAFLDIRHALELLIRSDSKGEELMSLSLEYQHRRAMLGQVDFFRLFCPLLPPGSQPNAESSPVRLKYFIDLRTKVARASQYVFAYARGRCVVNKGWIVPSRCEVKFRLAFDDSAENVNHDTYAKNEYYESVLSRDSIRQRKSRKGITQPGTLGASVAPGYSLVGFHTFLLPEVGSNHALAFDKDPVQGIPSLLSIVNSNPDLDFFCIAFFQEQLGVAMVKLFVRTLPKGVDTQFDNLFERFRAGEGKLALLINLCHGPRRSPIVTFGLKLLNKVFTSFRRGDYSISFDCSGERTRFPTFCLDSCMQLQRFGTNPQSRANYAAVTARLTSKRFGGFFSSCLCSLLKSVLPKITVDFSYALQYKHREDLQERMLGTIRLVSYDPLENAHPIELTTPGSAIQALSKFNITQRQCDGSHPLALDQQEVPARLARANVEEKIHAGIDDLIEILQEVRIPVNKLSLKPHQMELVTDVASNKLTTLPLHLRREDFVSLPVLELLDRLDLRRFYVASEFDLRKAAIRLVESAAWRGITFPIDTRTCRIELQTGQFFQQGEDINGNPVFYFRNMCVGPWRKDGDAVINAVLHRFETSLKSPPREKSIFKVTLVILLGRPIYRTARSRKPSKGPERTNDTSGKIVTETSPSGVQDNYDDDENADFPEVYHDEETNCDSMRMGVNPRLQPGEDYHVHTDRKLIRKLLDILVENYPERLEKAIIVPGKARGYGYWKTALGVQLAIRNTIEAKKTRSKCIVLHRACELEQFIHRSQIITIAGGEAPLQKGAFECT